MSRRPADDAPEVDRAFAHVLRQIRSEMRLSQEKFAERIGSGRTYIGELERVERGPTLAFMFKVADALDMKPDSLVRRIDRVRRRTPGGSA